MNLEENKQTVTAFYTQVFNAKDPEGAVAAYLGDHYIQHNPAAADGIRGFLAFVHASQQRAPQLHADIKRVIAEGGYVVTHQNDYSKRSYALYRRHLASRKWQDC